MDDNGRVYMPAQGFNHSQTESHESEEPMGWVVFQEFLISDPTPSNLKLLLLPPIGPFFCGMGGLTTR